MAEVFISFLIGHFIADFFLQPKEMAIKKSESTRWCMSHCILYTIVLYFCSCYFVCCRIYYDGWEIILYPVAIFLSHYFIDRYSLASKWLDLIEGRSIYDEVVHCKYHPSDTIGLVYLNFACIVYLITDNTMHIFLLWLISIWLGLGGG